MKNLILITTILISGPVFSQLPKKPFMDELRAYNAFNLTNINIGMSKAQVMAAMGGNRIIQIYAITTTSFGRVKYKQVANPYSVDMKTGKDGEVINILWYYTDQKHPDGAISKDELSPIVLENDRVVGIGWGFYEDYSKRKEIFVNVN